jgi:hypothetical protein
MGRGSPVLMLMLTVVMAAPRVPSVLVELVQ